MLVLALDTSTPSVTTGLVELAQAPCTITERVTVDARAHAELLIPQVVDCLAAVGRTPADLDAVVVGCGPGPFTGLRVGMASGAAYADACGIPVYGVCSLDAIARDAAGRGERSDGERHRGDLLVVTDARRREVYWARYRDGQRIDGPGVAKPAELDPGPATAVAGSPAHAALFGLPVVDVAAPSPAGLAGCAAAAILAHEAPAPLIPLYLRRPDAIPPKAVVR